MKTIAFSSIKGGTGKSSLCILTANHAAAAGYRVLVADLDLQNSATSYYLDSEEPVESKNIALALHTKQLTRNIVPSNYMGIDLLASNLNLADLRSVGEKTLLQLLEDEPQPYDFLFIDTPPTYDNLVLNAFHAADMILTPVLFSQFDFKGAKFFQAKVKREADKLSAWRILFNFYRAARSDNPDVLRNQYETLFRSTFGETIAPITIPESTLVRRAIDTGEKITDSAAKVGLYTAIGALAAYCGAERSAGRFKHGQTTFNASQPRKGGRQQLRGMVLL